MLPRRSTAPSCCSPKESRPGPSNASPAIAQSPVTTGTYVDVIEHVQHDALSTLDGLLTRTTRAAAKTTLSPELLSNDAEAAPDRSDTASTAVSCCASSASSC
jgi:hypothetical protein